MNDFAVLENELLTKMCQTCKGLGQLDDNDGYGMSCNTWECPDCKGSGIAEGCKPSSGLPSRDVVIPGGVDMLDGLHGSSFARSNEQVMIINHEVISVRVAIERGLVTCDEMSYFEGITTYHGVRPTKDGVPWKML